MAQMVGSLHFPLPYLWLKETTVIMQALSKVHAEAEMQFDLEGVKSKVAESFRQVESEISEQVSC